MKIPLLLFILTTAALLIPTGQVLAQHHHHTHGRATSRHCQTDYDHRPHYYHSGTHYHYCPGGAHYQGGGHSHGGKRYAAAYDPVVADIQRVLVRDGHYEHGHQQTDGIFGAETARAIRSYQRTQGLVITGLINAELLTAMGITAPAYGVATAITNPPGQPVQPPTPAVPSGDVLTPAEAATMLKVSEADVLSLLEKGELTGKKIGSSWRISREAITEFMKAQ
jgi:excisionase family DNA binding protein